VVFLGIPVTLLRLNNSINELLDEVLFNNLDEFYPVHSFALFLLKNKVIEVMLLGIFIDKEKKTPAFGYLNYSRNLIKKQAPYDNGDSNFLASLLT